MSLEKLEFSNSLLALILLLIEAYMGKRTQSGSLLGLFWKGCMAVGVTVFLLFLIVRNKWRE